MSSGGKPAGAIDVLEALYDLEQPRSSWFRGVLNVAASALDRGAGVGMLLYDVSEDVPRVVSIDGVNLGANGPQVGREIHDLPEFAGEIVQGYRTVLCATLDEHVRDPALNRSMRERYAPFGIRDQILINGANHSGFGCAFTVFSKERLHLTASERDQMTRLAAHLSTAYRLQRRLEPTLGGEIGAADAVLKVDGRLEHAEPAAGSRRVGGELTSAVKQREWARSPAGRSKPGRGISLWRPLIASRWTLVDRYERDGRRFIVARENSPAPAGPAALSSRERQVASLAGSGRSNKLIAYELGLAHSTVRVLLARAAAKLGARTRAELIEKLAAAGGL